MNVNKMHGSMKIRNLNNYWFGNDESLKILRITCSPFCHINITPLKSDEYSTGLDENNLKGLIKINPVMECYVVRMIIQEGLKRIKIRFNIKGVKRLFKFFINDQNVISKMVEWQDLPLF